MVLLLRPTEPTLDFAGLLSLTKCNCLDEEMTQEATQLGCKVVNVRLNEEKNDANV